MPVPYATTMGITGRPLVVAMTFIFPTAVKPRMATPILATLTVHQMGMGMEAGKLEMS